MDIEKLKKIEGSIENLKSKKSRIYFMVQDTKGNPKASVRHIYDIALTLFKNGFNPTIIHETNDYSGVSEWLNDDYKEEVFKKKEKPSKPIISIHTREARDTAKIIKSFYLKYPQFRWITFRDMRGIKQDDFANFLQESYLSIWVDNESGFGTFPLESMISGTPVIGKIPNLKPDWMTEENGLWLNNFNEIIDVVANFTQNWLEDNISENLYVNMKLTGENYQDSEKFEQSVVSLFQGYLNTRYQIFEEQLQKIKESENI